MSFKDKINKEGSSRSQRIRIKVENEAPRSEYYAKIAKRYKVLKFVSLGILLIYLLGMLVLYRSQITYDNLMYLMKDLDTDIDAAGTVFEDIKYDESSKLSAAMYKGYFAAATTGSLTLYNTTGNAEREFPISMENPKVLSGDKYLMVYDVGGNTYSLYTSLLCVLSKQTEYTLQGAALSENGCSAIITRARENRYSVNFYDENFKEVSKIYKDKYVMDAALSNDGKRYAVVSCEVFGTDVTCEVMSGRCDSESAATTTIDGAMPLECSFFSDGSFCVVCDSAVTFFSKDGAEVARRALNGHGVSGISFTGNSVMIVESRNIVDSRSTATVFDSTGVEIASETLEAKIASSALGNSAMFFAYDGKIHKISFDRTKIAADCPLSVVSLLPFSENVLICTPSSAHTGFSDEDIAAATPPAPESEAAFTPVD
ncbi:MAG: hypothetical protein IKN38_06550 [Clostridia bacterium]|nr:hypothetical protein [Clostridia bacterium]